MIIINGVHAPIDMSGLSATERTIFSLKDRSPVEYRYDSPGQLRFELRLRTSIMAASRALHASRARFASYKTSRCNEMYWIRTNKGGFQLRKNVPSSAAIRDIFANGPLYGFECSMAVVIVLYKAVLDTIGDGLFNLYFTDLLLWDWNYDSDLRLITVNNSREAYPGDVLYFENPDVSPETPWWQGENAVKLGDDLYYGHGIGIVGAARILEVLNKYRKPGAARSAYLLDQTTYPDFAYLFYLSSGRSFAYQPYERQFRNRYVVAKLGSSAYIRM